MNSTGQWKQNQTKKKLENLFVVCIIFLCNNIQPIFPSNRTFYIQYKCFSGNMNEWMNKRKELQWKWTQIKTNTHKHTFRMRKRKDTKRCHWKFTKKEKRLFFLQNCIRQYDSGKKIEKKRETNVIRIKLEWNKYSWILRIIYPKPVNK